jgi:archaellin
MWASKKGEGTGKLILLIAAILVAAIAATTFISMSYSLQGQSLLSAERTKEQISVATKILHIYAEDGTAPGNEHTIDQFYLKLKLQPGGKEIKLNDTFIGADFELASADLRYVDLPPERRNCSNNGNIAESDFWTDPTTQKGNYSVIYSIEGHKYNDGYLNQGDVITVCFQAPYRIPESSHFGLRFVPKPGVATTFESETPDVINQKRVIIYPIRNNG